MKTFLENLSPTMLGVVIVVVLFDFIMRSIGLWKAAKNGEKGWFVAMLLLSTAGILPLIYIKLVKKGN